MKVYFSNEVDEATRAGYSKEFFDKYNSHIERYLSVSREIMRDIIIDYHEEDCLNGGTVPSAIVTLTANAFVFLMDTTLNKDDPERKEEFKNVFLKLQECILAIANSVNLLETH